MGKTKKQIMGKSVVAFSLNEFDPTYTRVLIGNAIFRGYIFTNLGTLEVITGVADFRFSKVKDLGNLTTINGNANFYDSKVESLGNLTTIGGYANFERSQVENLGNLTTIGGNADFGGSQVESLGNLTTIGGYADFQNSQITNLGTLEVITGNANFRGSQVENLGKLTTIGGDADFRDSQVESLGKLTTINGNVNFRSSQIENLGNLSTIGGNAYFSYSQVESLGNLTTIGDDADFSHSKIEDFGKLKTIKGLVLFDNKELADQWKKISNKDNFKTGGQPLSKTPAPKKDRVYGSKKNKPESSKDTKSAEKIEFNEKTLETIKNKVAEHNENNPNKKVTLASAKAVVRRGMGAYSSTHRPTISGGKPNSRVAWGLARLNAFFYKIINGKSKSGKYSQDDDLINELGYKVAKYVDGGLIAPNGKPSNLTPEQYKLVRTTAFKQWFGDWENDPENASKVVDSNGEPLVVYHGTNAEINIFDIEKIHASGESVFKFTTSYEMARGYGKNVYAVFLSIKNNEIGHWSSQKKGLSKFYANTTFDKARLDLVYESKKADESQGGVIYGLISNDLNYNGDVYFVHFPNQIKLADGTNTTFDGNNPDIRFMAGGRTKKAKTDRSGNYIGDGSYHVDYFIEDMTEYPQVKISVSKSDSTESVYVRYFNEDNAESITARFSTHENNAVKFGEQLNGYIATKNEILYKLGLINRKFIPNTYLSITKRQVKKVDLPKYEESDLSIKEMYDLGEGADISMHKGKIAKGSNYLIQGDTVEKIITDTGRIEYFVNGGNVPKKRRRKKGA